MQDEQTSSGFHSEFLGLFMVGASVSQDASLLAKLRLKPLPLCWRCLRCGQVPQRLALRRVPGRDQVDHAVVIHRTSMRLVGLAA